MLLLLLLLVGHDTAVALMASMVGAISSWCVRSRAPRSELRMMVHMNDTPATAAAAHSGMQRPTHIIIGGCT